MMSNITLGLWALGKSEDFHAPKSARDAKDVIKAAYRKGIRSFDSAFSYGTDSLLYSALREMGKEKEDVEIFEKIMPCKSLKRKAEASLRSLKRDSLDAIIIHWPSGDEKIYSALRDAEALVKEGKFNSLGVSNFPLPLTEKLRKDFDIAYDEYFSSPAMLREKADGLKSLKYGIFSFGSLLSDNLSGRRKELYYYKGKAHEEFLKLKALIEEVSLKNKKSIKETLISFALFDKPHRIIIGASRSEHLDDLSSYEMEASDYNAIAKKAETLMRYNTSDNIFGHAWRKNESSS